MHHGTKRYAIRMALLALAALPAAAAAAADDTATLRGQPRVWQRLTLDFAGPEASEDGPDNPFLDCRLTVIFRHGEAAYAVPGFFAADGRAGDTGAAAGNVWRVHFVPDAPGEWTWLASFRTGERVAIDLDPLAGTPAAFDGAAGSFTVAPADPAQDGLRARGMLRYVGRHHLQYAGSGEFFLKAGADSPENLLAYHEFDGTRDLGGAIPDFLHRFEPHVSDWREGDPTWAGGKGKGLIGALNYLAGQGVNSVYFLTYNIDGGDGEDTWPWVSPEARDRFDCSRLDQWEVAFDHMDALGIQLHVVTQETENDRKLGGDGTLNDLRMLYYRELVARFGHHLAVMWNLGEENNNTDPHRKAFASYIRALDPYDHPITVHTHYGSPGNTYGGLFGAPLFEATSIQGNASDYNRWAIEFREASAAAGRAWAIFGDEQGPAVDKSMSNVDSLRREALWGNLMGGGAGVEWYWGYQGDFGDLQSEDFRAGEPLWATTRHATAFFREHLPFAEMSPANELAGGAKALVLAAPGAAYAVYLPEGGSATLDLPAGTYRIRWYDPRSGGPLRDGEVRTVDGGPDAALGPPPNDAGADWAILVTPQ